MARPHVGFFPLAAPFVTAALLILAVLVLLIELRVLEYAYERIGVSSRYLSLTLLGTVLGSYVNVPLWRVHGREVSRVREVRAFGVRWVVPVLEANAHTVVAINLGGAIIPVLLSLRIILVTQRDAEIALATGCVAVVSYLLARPVRGIGIVVPTIVPPLAATAAALLLSRDAAPAIAYVAGTLGTLVGADLLHLRGALALGAPVLSIGGAGTFDGIFLTGILAALLA
jgi:uncharacterized membrane protein